LRIPLRLLLSLFFLFILQITVMKIKTR